MKFQPNPLQLGVLANAQIRFGPVHAFRMACEELAETIVALCHYEREREPVEKIMQEFADAIVCTSQVIYYEYGELESMERFIDEAFAKLKGKIVSGDVNHGHAEYRNGRRICKHGNYADTCAVRPDARPCP